LTFITAGAAAPVGGVKTVFQSGSWLSQNSQRSSFLVPADWSCHLARQAACV